MHTHRVMYYIQIGLDLGKNMIPFKQFGTNRSIGDL